MRGSLLLPMGLVLLGYFVFNITLPTLMFVSFTLLLIAFVVCWLTADPEGVMSSKGLITLFIAQSSAVGVLIVFLVRVLTAGMLFTWL
jgi:hypothetical protein